MNEELQNKTIAEACKWKWSTDNGWGISSEGKEVISYPNYVDSLNLMHKAEKYITGETWIKYVNIVMDMNESYKGLCHATSQQKAEAFIRAIDKWKA